MPNADSKPLDAERDRLRAKGFTEEQINKILMDAEIAAMTQRAAATGAGTGGTTAGNGVMSGVLNNLSVALAYASGFLPSVGTDIANLFGGGISLQVRSRAGVFLVAKLGFAAVVGFGIYQEWQQHIISGTKTAEGQAINVTAQGDNAVIREKAVAEKAAADAKKMQAEADIAKDVAAGEKAKACSARLELLAKNMYIEDLEDGGRKVKAGSRTAKMMEAYNKDCEPVTGASGAKPSQDTTDAIEAAVKTYQAAKKISIGLEKPKFDEEKASIHSACLFGLQASVRLQHGDTDPSKKMMDEGINVCTGATFLFKIAQIKGSAVGVTRDLSKDPEEDTRKFSRHEAVATEIKQCTDRNQSYEGLLACSCIAGARVGVDEAISSGDDPAKQNLFAESERLCQIVSAKFAESDGPAAERNYQKRRQATAKLSEIGQIERADKAGDYAMAYTLSRQHVAATEADEVKESGKAGTLTASALSNLSWQALFARKFSEALAAADRSLTFDPSDLVPTTNRAHALMLLDRVSEARALYLGHQGEPLQGKTWDKVVAEDFDKLRKAGITHPLMAEIEGAFAGQDQKTKPAPPSPREAPPAERAAPQTAIYATINTVQLKLRSCPEFSSRCPEVARMSQGVRVKVLGDAGNGWVKLSAPTDDGSTVQGFANSKYLQF